MKPRFKPGNNIAMKVPTQEFEATVAFYRDILGFELIESLSSDNKDSVVFRFGDKNLWIDKAPQLSRSEIWLEVRTDDIDIAADYLAEKQCVRRDDIELLPDGFSGFWISSPTNVIHLITADKA